MKNDLMLFSQFHKAQKKSVNETIHSVMNELLFIVFCCVAFVTLPILGGLFPGSHHLWLSEERLSEERPEVI